MTHTNLTGRVGVSNNGALCQKFFDWASFSALHESCTVGEDNASGCPSLHICETSICLVNRMHIEFEIALCRMSHQDRLPRERGSKPTRAFSEDQKGKRTSATTTLLVVDDFGKQTTFQDGDWK